MTVTMYRANRVDQAEQHDPDQLAADFIATLKGEANPDYKSSGRLNLEFEYRWFLTSPTAGGLAWEEKDWPVLWAALNFRLEGLDEDAYSEVIRSLG